MTTYLLIEKHQNYIKNTLGFAPSTYTNHLRTLTNYEKFCRQQKLTLKTAKKETIIDFLESLPVSPNTKYNYLCIIRKFYKFLIYTEQITYNPAKKVPRPVTIPKNHQLYSIEDVVRLIQTEKQNTIMSIRNRTILELLYATGMRCSELTGLQLFDVDLHNKILKVIGKCSKERLIPINEIAISTLQNYLQYRPRLLKKNSNSYMFISKNGNPLTRQSIWRLIKSRSKKAGLGKRFTVHTLRHCFATHMLYNGANLRVVQKLLGHANIQTTQIYTNLDNNRLKNLHQKHHPRA